jgi:hypothetical protein
MAATYRIADEPAPSHLARLAVNPLFPFLTVMLGGAGLGFAWFAFNSFAVGSPTKPRELAWLFGGLVAVALLLFAADSALETGLLQTRHLPYAGLVFIVAKLAATYAVYVLQSRTIEIYQYYGGALKNGLPLVIAALLLGDRLLEPLPVFLRVILQ